MPEKDEGFVPPQDTEPMRERSRDFYGEKVRIAIALAEGKDAEYEEDRGFNGVEKIIFRSDGSVRIEDPETGVSEVPAGDKAGMGFVDEILEAAVFIKRVADTIPSGNLEDMGGLEGLAKAFLVTKTADAYHEASLRKPKEGELPWKNYGNLKK